MGLKERNLSRNLLSKSASSPNWKAWEMNVIYTLMAFLFQNQYGYTIRFAFLLQSQP